MSTLLMSSSSERKVLSSFKNCLMRVILASNKGLKKTGRSLIYQDAAIIPDDFVVNALVLRKFVSIIFLPILK